MTESSIPDISSVASPPRRDLNYRLVKEGELIGSGGQAIVKRVELPGEELPQRVAVKEPQQPAKTVDMEVVESFFEEARTWRALDSREREKPLWADSEHIVGVVDIGEDLPWLAMEYMDGGSLADRLDENPNGLPLDEALWIGECLCNGVKLAHDYGIAHLDLKPANVLFRETGDGTWDVPKIADWGLSRVLIEHSGSMDALSVEYAAPEQFDSSQFGDPDKYTDIYQLGVIVYTLLTGRPPYTGNQASIMHSVVFGDQLPSPTNHRTDIPESVHNIFNIALSRTKSDRFSDAGQLGEELQNLRVSDPSPENVVRNQVTSSCGQQDANKQENSPQTEDAVFLSKSSFETYDELKTYFRNMYAEAKQKEKSIFREFSRLDEKYYNIFSGETVKLTKQTLDRLYELDDVLLSLDSGSTRGMTQRQMDDIPSKLLDIQSNLYDLDAAIRAELGEQGDELEQRKRLQEAIGAEREYLQRSVQSLDDTDTTDLTCPECNSTILGDSRTGDICPECHRGYLVTRD